MRNGAFTQPTKAASRCSAVPDTAPARYTGRYIRNPATFELAASEASLTIAVIAGSPDLRAQHRRAGERALEHVGAVRAAIGVILPLGGGHRARFGGVARRGVWH